MSVAETGRTQLGEPAWPNDLLHMLQVVMNNVTKKPDLSDPKLRA